jgi:hypothetical protein
VPGGGVLAAADGVDGERLDIAGCRAVALHISDGEVGEVDVERLLLPGRRALALRLRRERREGDREHEHGRGEENGALHCAPPLRIDGGRRYPAMAPVSTSFARR